MLKRFNFLGSNSTVNQPIKSFFIKLVIFIVAWQLLYNFVLKPTNIPDHFLSNITAKATVVFINTFMKGDSKVVMDAFPAGQTMVTLSQENKVVFIIDNICNALDLMVIYLSILFLLPYYTWKRKISFALVGLVVINIANVIRCSLLYWVYYYHKPMFDLNHKYIFTLLLYLLIFFGWILFIRKDIKSEKS